MEITRYTFVCVCVFGTIKSITAPDISNGDKVEYGQRLGMSRQFVDIHIPNHT